MAEKERITPVELASQAFGGQAGLARALERSSGAISQWAKGTDTRPPGDFPSVADVRKVRDAATAAGKVLSLEEMVYGRMVDHDGK